MQLVKIGVDHFEDVCSLSVAPEQRDFVAPNPYSLAEACAVQAEGRFVQPFALYEGPVPVGFAM